MEQPYVIFPTPHEDVSKEEKYQASRQYLRLYQRMKEKGLSLDETRAFIQSHIAFLAEDVRPLQNVFDPKFELEELRNAPTETYRERSAAFKDKLLRQGEAIASCTGLVELLIESNPDIGRGPLLLVLREYAKRYGFPQGYVELGQDFIETYQNKHKGVQTLIAETPNVLDLMEKLTSTCFEDATEFEVTAGPVSIDILTTRANAKKITTEVDIAGTTTNAFQFTAKNGMLCTVQINDVPQSEWKAIRVHEYEHVKNRVLHSFFVASWDKAKNFELQNRLFAEKDEQIKRALAEARVRNMREEYLFRAKDEIFAMFKGRQMNDFSLFTTHNGNPYDYTKVLREESKNWDESMKAALAKVCGPEYDKIVQNAINAFERTLDQGGFSRNNASGLFLRLRLQEWPALARRLSIRKKQKNMKKAA